MRLFKFIFKLFTENERIIRNHKQRILAIPIQVVSKYQYLNGITQSTNGHPRILAFHHIFTFTFILCGRVDFRFSGL